MSYRGCREAVAIGVDWELFCQSYRLICDTALSSLTALSSDTRDAAREGGSPKVE